MYNKNVLKNLFKGILICLILFSLYLTAFPVLHNDVGYNTDTARDLLILQNIVKTHKLPLIGPRTGGIDGLFHGPLWPYINLPAFIIGKGNPIIIGQFWVLLVICSLSIVYFVSVKIFNQYVGLISALLLSLALVGGASSFLNPFGAALLSPLFFYFLYRYLQSMKIVYLLLTFFTIGLMIQFEVAFGGPMLILSFVYLLIFLYKKKKLLHLLSIFILILPLSTYILFDLRHNFLQLKAVIHHIGAPTGNGKETFMSILNNRLHGIVTSIMSTPYAPFWISLIVLIFFIYIFIKSYRNKDMKNRQLYLLFSYLYFGYWPLSFYLNGDVLGIHVFPFIPLAIIILSSSYLFIKREIYVIILLLILFFNFKYDISLINNFKSFSGIAEGSWTFNYNLAKKVYSLAPSSFGYYVFTPDELGYGSKYALTYTGKQFPKKIAYPYVKKPITFIILAPVNGGKNNNNRTWWIKNRVRITNLPIRRINYPNGYTIEEFNLTNKEIQIPSDQNLMSGLFYR